MGLPPIKLRLGGDELHLVDTRELDRWGGYLNARRAAFSLVTPENIAALRTSLLVTPSTNSEGVFTELRKQLEDGSALFFEVPQAPVRWDAPAQTDLIDLIPKGGGDDTNGGGPTPNTSLHWIEIVCISAKGKSFAGSKARLRLPGGRSEFVTLDSRSAVRFDDLSDSGTAHFELSGDATPVGSVQLPAGTRYDLGASIGVVTARRHVLIVHPNPEAFVSVELLIGGEPVPEGAYTLTTKQGEFAGALGGDPARDEGFPLPSAATYAFEGVIVPPRPADDDDDDKNDDDKNDDDNTDDDNTDDDDTDDNNNTDDNNTDPPNGPVTPVGPGGLPPSVGIALTLRHAQSEKPLPGARVKIIVGGEERTATANADGLVTFDKLPAGATSVEAFLIGGGELPPPPVTPPVAPEPPAGDFPAAEDDDDFEPGEPEGEPAEPYEREDGEASDEDDE